jgi:hypothetical protein
MAGRRTSLKIMSLASRSATYAGTGTVRVNWQSTARKLL